MIDSSESQHEMDLDTAIDQPRPGDRNPSEAWGDAKEERAAREQREGIEPRGAVRNQHSFGADEGEVDTAQNYHGAQDPA